jgi:Beta-propeller repeat
MELLGANRHTVVSGLDELPGKVNYFTGPDTRKWHTGVRTYAKVKYEDVYPGVDLLYYGRGGQLEYDFVVAPGVDPETIALRIEGAEKLEVDARGDLVFHVARGQIRQRKPVIYQEVDGVRREVSGSYVLEDNHQIRIHVGAYDRARPLVIDPVLLYSTYVGGSGDDLAADIALDSAGNAYATGWTFRPISPPRRAAWTAPWAGPRTRL